MKNCLSKILLTLKTYDTLGPLEKFVVHPDGTSQAIYQHGTNDYDAEGKHIVKSPLPPLSVPSV